MLFSVIVPIYKVADYLPQCIESVINQDFVDFELLLVNDGSPDDSGRISEAYASKDGRIRVIHKKNGGVSDARNVGIQNAIGDYIWFLDGDDYMAEEAMANIAAVIRKNPGVELITGSHIKDFGEDQLTVEPLPISSDILKTDRKAYLNLLQQNYWPFWAPWENIYQHDIIVNNEILFNKDLKTAEDCAFFMTFVRQAEHFVLANIPFVYYRTNREGSAMNSLSKSTVVSQLSVFRDNHQLYFEEKNPGMQTYFANRYANIVSTLHGLKEKQDIQDVVKIIEKERRILKDAKGKKYLIAKGAWKVFGFYKGSVLLEKINSKLRTTKFSEA